MAKRAPRSVDVERFIWMFTDPEANRGILETQLLKLANKGADPGALYPELCVAKVASILSREETKKLRPRAEFWIKDRDAWRRDVRRVCRDGERLYARLVHLAPEIQLVLRETLRKTYGDDGPPNLRTGAPRAERWRSSSRSRSLKS